MCYNELGHSQQEQESCFQYREETEAIVNFVWTYVRHEKFGDTFNAAFKGSMDHSNYEPDDAAVDWMITPNFRAGKEMDRSHTVLDAFRYQHRGYAKYADIVRLFGWQAWTWNNVTWLFGASWLDGMGLKASIAGLSNSRSRPTATSRRSSTCVASIRSM